MYVLADSIDGAVFELQTKSSIELPSTPPNDETGAVINSRDEARTVQPGCDDVYSQSAALGRLNGTSLSIGSADDRNSLAISCEKVDDREVRVKRGMAGDENRVAQFHEVQITVFRQLSNVPLEQILSDFNFKKAWAG